MTAKQRQAAVVCAVCALAIVVTASVTGVVVSGKIKAAGNVSSSVNSGEISSVSSWVDDYVLDDENPAVLPVSEDAGENYIKETLFVGDSNTERFYKNGLMSLQNYVAKEGISIQGALTDDFVSFKGDKNHYTMAEAIQKMKPRRILITLGTNNIGGDLSAEEFAAEYKKFVEKVVEKYPYCDIIVNAIPPIPKQHSNYPKMKQDEINEYNMALAELCREKDWKFLNSAEVLRGENGYGLEDYFVSNDIHFKSAGLKALLEYVRTHAYQTQDRRPDVKNIPQRTENYISGGNISTMVPTASPKPVLYTAKYQVDTAGGGAISAEHTYKDQDDKEQTEKIEQKTSLVIEITDKSEVVKVKAIPAEGYVFVRWSDGVTKAERTDSGFKQNMNVTATFAKVSVAISDKTTDSKAETKEYAVTVTGITADLKNVVWYVNGTEQSAKGEKFSLKTEPGKEYSVYAVLAVNEAKVKSNVIEFKTEVAATPIPSATPTATPTPTETPEPTAETTSTPNSEPTAETTPVPEGGETEQTA